MSQQEEMKNLSLLGNKETNYIFDYQPEVLESFDNRHVENDYFIKFNCPEFTSLCPITAQPDFATIYISYIPDKLCVESKSLKLYLFSYRNHGDFHENCINTIGKDLVNLLDPRYLEVWGNSLREVAFQLILTTTTVSQELSMKSWQNNASSNTTFIQRKLTTAKLIRKSPVPQAEEQGFLFFNYSSVPRKFFATRAARTPPTIGARMKIQTC